MLARQGSQVNCPFYLLSTLAPYCNSHIHFVGPSTNHILLWHTIKSHLKAAKWLSNHYLAVTKIFYSFPIAPYEGYPSTSSSVWLLSFYSHQPSSPIFTFKKYKQQSQNFMEINVNPTYQIMSSNILWKKKFYY